MTMRTVLIVAIACLSSTGVGVGQEKRALTDIRQIDFRNFRYPWRETTIPDGFRWLTRFDTAVSLRDGVHVFKDEQCGRTCPQLSISEVLYTDVNDDGVMDAIVLLSYWSGGTAYWEYAYMYTTERSKFKLIAAFQTGSRLAHGLHRIYQGNGHLIIELNEADEAEGECCATWRTRTEYKWSGDHFEPVSEPIKEPIPLHERTWYIHQ